MTGKTPSSQVRVTVSWHRRSADEEEAATRRLAFTVLRMLLATPDLSLPADSMASEVARDSLRIRPSLHRNAG